MARRFSDIERRVLEQALDMFVALMLDLSHETGMDQQMVKEDHETGRALYLEVTGKEWTR